VYLLVGAADAGPTAMGEADSSSNNCFSLGEDEKRGLLPASLLPPPPSQQLFSYLPSEYATECEDAEAWRDAYCREKRVRQRLGGMVVEERAKRRRLEELLAAKEFHIAGLENKMQHDLTVKELALGRDRAERAELWADI